MNTDNSPIDGIINRRHFLGLVAAAGAAVVGGRLARAAEPEATAAGRPNSAINGVHIGCITYSFRNSGIDTAEQTLKALIDAGLSETELMDGPIRAFGALPVQAKKGDEPGAPRFDKERAKLRQGMLARAIELRKLYNDAGVNIHIHKAPFGQSDDEIDFNFELAKALGCRAITTERRDHVAKRLAPFADKHKIYVAFHNHDKNLPQTDKLDPLLGLSEYMAFNFDIGHYILGTKGKSPIPVIEKYHDRIISLHLKDRTPDGGNVPWGQGSTPIGDVLRLLKKEKWPIYGDIELEYPVPKGSTPVEEVARCLAYCREALA